jgi:predicted P-loop ATPase
LTNFGETAIGSGYRAGATWWLDSKELVEAASGEQQERYDADPWQPLIEQWIEGKQYVTVEQILEFCLDNRRSNTTRRNRSLTSVRRWRKWHQERFSRMSQQ